MDCYGLAMCLSRSLLPHKSPARGWQKAKKGLVTVQQPLCPLTPWGDNAIARCEVQCSKKRLHSEAWFVLGQILFKYGIFQSHEEQPVAVSILWNPCFESSALFSFVGFKCKNFSMGRKKRCICIGACLLRLLWHPGIHWDIAEVLYIRNSVERWIQQRTVEIFRPSCHICFQRDREDYLSIRETERTCF